MPNDVLTLKLDPRPAPITTAGGKGKGTIKGDRLAGQTTALAAQAAQLAADAATQAQPIFAGRVHIVARMFSDSYAPTHLPSDLFAPEAGYRIVAPLGDAYLIEADAAQLPDLAIRIRDQATQRIKSDISRVEELALYNAAYARQGLTADQLWEAAVSRGDDRLFFLWLIPAHDTAARQRVWERLSDLRNTNVFLPAAPSRTQATPDEPNAVTVAAQDRFIAVQNSYQRDGRAMLAVRIPSRDNLNTLIASGAVVRVDPVRRLTTAAPGEGREPGPNPDLSTAPIVAVIDGGRTAGSYDHAEAWRANPPFVPDRHANTRHGNAVTSLVVNGHDWNNNRQLPALYCRVGVVQAVPRDDAPVDWDEFELIEHLAAVARDHPDAMVWNISANQPPLGTGRVSVLGHMINSLARAAGILPVISVGNVHGGNDQLAPPADCDAALVVGGHRATADGTPGDPCTVCCKGPGPDLMQKPDVSNFSELRVLGGSTVIGSSYANAITAPLSAHALLRLREPDPDLAKALLLHATERDQYDPRLGWGSPYNGRLPWECEQGAITMSFKAAIRPGFAYYWEIPILPGLLRDGKLCGGFKLTGILNPRVNPSGTGNYYASRLQTNLQFLDGREKRQAILGSLKEGETEEQEARSGELRKWRPVRHYPLKTIPRGRGFSGNTLRLYAQVFVRDKYLFGWSANEDIPEQSAAFVLTFVSPDQSPDFYDSSRAVLRQLVETAILQEHEIEIDQ